MDCANGVGSIGFRKLEEHLKPYIDIEIRNFGNGVLNYGCGSDYVQKNKQLPICYSETDYNKQCISVDGDCDRVLCYISDGNVFRLIDGDKISCLFGKWIDSKLKILELENRLTMIIVQTAYANGASFSYIDSMGIKKALAKTGVKNLHHIAKEYDIGIYFEANGHGTVIFSENAKKTLDSYISKNVN